MELLADLLDFNEGSDIIQLQNRLQQMPLHLQKAFCEIAHFSRPKRSALLSRVFGHSPSWLQSQTVQMILQDNVESFQMLWPKINGQKLEVPPPVQGVTVWDLVCWFGAKQIIRFLLSNDTEKERHKSECISFACASGDPEIVRLLEQHGFDNYWKSLSRSIQSHNPVIMKWLIEENKEAPSLPRLYEAIDSYNIEAIKYLMKLGIKNDVILIKAAQSGSIDILKAIYEYMPCVVVSDFKNNTPLIAGAESVEIIEFCIRNGCDINEYNNAGVTALEVAITKEAIESIKYLLSHGATTTHPKPRFTGNSALHSSLSRPKSYLDFIPNFDSPLSLEICRILASCGCQISSKVLKQSIDDEALFSYLLKFPIEPKVLSKILPAIIYKNNLEKVVALVEAGADLDAKVAFHSKSSNYNSDPKKPLGYAIDFGCEKIEEYLISKMYERKKASQNV